MRGRGTSQTQTGSEKSHLKGKGCIKAHKEEQKKGGELAIGRGAINMGVRSKRETWGKGLKE